jgi:hypothetical protein
MSSVASSDLIFYSCANVGVDDTSTVGGAIDATARVAFTQLGANAHLAMVSDGADTRNVTWVYRDSAGSIQAETKALNGATEVVFAGTGERTLSVTAASSSGTRTVTLKQGSGGSTIGTIPPNEVKRHIQFQNSSSSGSTQVRNEKQFLKNNSADHNLLGATVTLTNDPQAVIQIGLGTVGGTATATNRLTAASGVSFVDDNVAIAVPGTDLGFGTVVEVWIQQTLAANAAANKNTFTLSAAGATT